jgi:hypothetical protein
MISQGSSDRTLALPSPPHAIRVAVRSTAFRVACWVGGIAAWLVLAIAAGAQPMTMMSGTSMTADRADRAAARSSILR